MDENYLRKREKAIIFWVLGLFAALLGGFLGGTFLIKSQYAKYDDPNIQKIVDAYDLMKNEWYFGKDIENYDEYLTNKAIEGLLDNDDPYTFYTSSMEEQGLSTQRLGFGVSHAFYGGYRYLNEVYVDSPADKAGLKAGDIWMGYYEGTNYIDFRAYSKDEGMAKLNAYEPDEVTFKINSNGVIKDVTMTRGSYEYGYVKLETKMVDGEFVAIFDIDTFLNQSVPTFVEKEINKLLETRDEIDRVVFDLRDNGGGYVMAATGLVELFAPANSKIMTYMYANGTSDVLYSRKPMNNVAKLGEFVILQNENSASASETFTVAMRDLVSATVVGTKSYGKGIIQNFHQFPDGSVIRYTMAESLSPNGYSIHGTGIYPTIGYEVAIDNDLYFSYFGDQKVLSDEMKIIILAQINFILNSSHTDFVMALNAFQESIQAEIASEMTRTVAQDLQMKIWDKYLEINITTYNLALGA